MNARVFFRTGRACEMLAGAVALLLLSSAFPSPAWAITGGEPDGNRHPNVVAVIAHHPMYGLLPFTGTLIHPRVILTAGHAVAMIESGEVTLYGVSFGQEADLQDPSTWLPVSAVVARFTGLNANPHGADIAALVLKDPVTSVAPATLPTAGFLDNLRKAGQLQAGPQATRFTVVGYGYGLDWPPPQPIYPVSDEGVVIRNAALSGYMSMNDGWLHLSQNFARGYGGTAVGDSGGPTFWTDPGTGQEVLVSITSWGDFKWVNTGITYRIDTESSLQFIQDVIDSLEE
jgi:hypothetical protein